MNVRGGDGGERDFELEKKSANDIVSVQVSDGKRGKPEQEQTPTETTAKTSRSGSIA